MRRLLFAYVLLTATAAGQIDERISQADFKKLVAARAVSIVDTRSEHDFAEAHIPGALSLPDSAVGAAGPEGRKIVEQLKAARHTVVVYCACSAESTSLRVARLLRAAGVADARALTGGWADWYNDGNPIERKR